MIFRFASGSACSGQPVEKFFLSGDHQPDSRFSALDGAKCCLDFFALVLAEQAVVNENAGELIADGTRQQRRNHTGIHPSGKPENHALVTHQLANMCNRLVDDVGRGPETFAAADGPGEVADDVRTQLRMGDLGMKLHAVEPPLAIFHGGDGRRRRARGDSETRWYVRSPCHRDSSRPTALNPELANGLQQSVPGSNAYDRMTELAHVGCGHDPTQLLRHRLHAVADAEHGHPEVQNYIRYPRRLPPGD